MKDNPLLLAEIIGWLKCHREEQNVQYANYIATLRRTILKTNHFSDFRTIKQLRSHLINCANEARSVPELRCLQVYIKLLESTKVAARRRESQAKGQ